MQQKNTDMKKNILLNNIQKVTSIRRGIGYRIAKLHPLFLAVTFF